MCLINLKQAADIISANPACDKIAVPFTISCMQTVALIGQQLFCVSTLSNTGIMCIRSYIQPLLCSY